jgi:thiol:disulfide interchange protein DsbG
MKRILIALTVVTLLNAPVLAASATPPDPAANPVLANIQKAGAKLFYLGNRMGMPGWFIVKDGQVQIVYATPDNKGAVVGALFGEDGENVTTIQVSSLVQNNVEVAELVANAAKEQAAISQVGSPPPAASATEQPSGTGLPSASLSPGERLIHDLSNAATVVVGNPSAPELLMVMDPHCTHCQATWKAMRDNVFKGRMHIRMIPIGTADSDNERAAAMLLGVSDPLNVWDKYVAGDKSQLVGTPPAPAIAAVRANHGVIDSWKIEQTPYLVYRGKDGKVKVVQGEPDKMATVLADMGL